MKKNKTKSSEDPLYIDKQVIISINKTMPKSSLSEEIEIAHEYLDELGLARKDQNNAYYDLPHRIKLLIKSK